MRYEWLLELKHLKKCDRGSTGPGKGRGNESIEALLSEQEFRGQGELKASADYFYRQGCEYLIIE